MWMCITCNQHSFNSGKLCKSSIFLILFWNSHSFVTLGQPHKFDILSILFLCKNKLRKLGSWRFSILDISWSHKQRLVKVIDIGVRLDILFNPLSNKDNFFRLEHWSNPPISSNEVNNISRSSRDSRFPSPVASTWIELNNLVRENKNKSKLKISLLCLLLIK